MNVALGDAEARFHVSPAVEGSTPPGDPDVQVRRGFAGAAERSSDSFLQRALLFALTTQVHLSYAPVNGLSIGGWARLDRTGLEGRLQLLSQEYGGPFAAAISLAALAPSFYGSAGVGGRFGLDLSRDFGGFLFTLGAYGSWEPRQRHMARVPAGVMPQETSLYGPIVVLDEWKLTLPLGLLLGEGSDPRLVLGVVPEWVLSSTLQHGECHQCGGATVAGFRQGFALFITLGAEI